MEINKNTKDISHKHTKNTPLIKSQNEYGKTNYQQNDIGPYQRQMEIKIQIPIKINITNIRNAVEIKVLLSS